MQLLQGWAAGSTFLVKSLLSDIVDYDELISGNRREAMYMMTAEFFPKFTQIPAQATLFYLLASFKYEPPGDWSCHVFGPGQDSAWCDSQRPSFLAESRSFLKYSLNKESLSTGALCGHCPSNCCTSTDPYQNVKVIWLLKCGISLVPCLFMFLGFVALLFYPKGAADKEASEMIISRIQNQHQNEVVKDPWFPEKTLPPLPPPQEHTHLLMHLWPSEVSKMLRPGEHKMPDYTVPIYSCCYQIVFGVLLAVVGLAVFAAGWEDLQNDLGGSISPLGAMSLGLSVVVIWFNGVRYQAASQIRRLQVSKVALRHHFNYLCRFTGDEAYSSTVL